MLPEDIAQRPVVDLGVLARAAAEFRQALLEAKSSLTSGGAAVAYFEEQTSDLIDPYPPELVEASRRMKANRWRVWPILIALILFAVLSVLVVPTR
jgi:hypothetical protein